jgi:hypothetical protein
MVSSPDDQDDQIEVYKADRSDRAASALPNPDGTTQMDTSQVFRLIDSILPFEACLYHQVLPLSLEGSRLKLGMVGLEDAAALDYVRRILAYMNCSLSPQSITAEVHKAVLTAYLNHSETQQTANKLKQLKPGSPDVPASANARTASNGSVPDHKPTAPAEPPQQPKPDRSTAPTLLVHSPEELTFIDEQPIADATEVIAPLPASTTEVAALPIQGVQPTLILEPDAPVPPETPPTIPSPIDALPTLEVNPQHLSDPVDVLGTLPPDALLQELLGRILVGGIGRLYFERQAQHGRILWSQNGVLQSVLEALPLESFQGVIDALKQLTHLPIEPLQKPKQVEIERLYQKHRLLLRLRIMPNTHGEEATLQVLRGAALRFYQQQQIASLSRDALGIAKELQQKMDELRQRSRSHSTLTPEQLSILPALDEVLRSVGQQLEVLRSMQTEGTNEETV